jgi:hypothetical protein
MAPTRLLWTMIMVAGVGAIAPAQAKISASLANKCQAMAWQAHPATLPHIQATTNLRRNSYRFCIARRGIMDPITDRVSICQPHDGVFARGLFTACSESSLTGCY